MCCIFNSNSYFVRIPQNIHAHCTHSCQRWIFINANNNNKMIVCHMKYEPIFSVLNLMLFCIYSNEVRNLQIRFLSDNMGLYYSKHSTRKMHANLIWFVCNITKYLLTLCLESKSHKPVWWCSVFRRFFMASTSEHRLKSYKEYTIMF